MELRARGLEVAGNRPELVVKLEKDRRKGAGCPWTGCVGEVVAHLGVCEWETVKCTSEGCTEAPPRKEWAEHVATCKLRGQKCRHCKTVVREAFRSYPRQCIN